MVGPEGEPTLTIVSDASSHGYGAFAMTRASPEWKVFSGVWPTHLLSKVGSSVFAEPEAIYLACLRFVRPEDRFVRIYTDHMPLVYACKAGYAKGYYPNELMKRLDEKFPHVRFHIQYVKGVDNPADGPSRLGGVVGGDYEVSKEEQEKLDTLLEAGVWGAVKDNVTIPADKSPSFMH